LRFNIQSTEIEPDAANILKSSEKLESTGYSESSKTFDYNVNRVRHSREILE